MFLKRGNRAGQLTIFIILAILIFGIVLTFLLIKPDSSRSKVPEEFDQIYNSFISCIEEDVSTGIEALEMHGGYIYLPDKEEGSIAYPFSSQLSFMGISIPYWYYISGSGFNKYRVPSVDFMEGELEKFLESRIGKCDFEKYYLEGIDLRLGNPKADINIQDNKVTLDLKMEFIVSKEDERFASKEHKVVVNSYLGSLYESSLKIYDKEQEELFLEKYGVDILNLYAPVNGVEFTCSPKLWEANSIFNNLEEAIEINTLALKTQSEKNEDYFLVDIPFEEGINARFINSRNWPRSFEVAPSEENILRANPIGNQQGLGVLGFCYVTYHFVYNINYPVLVQVYKGNEIFQFPMAVVIRGNKEREPLQGSAIEIEEIELCKDKNIPTRVNVYNKQGDPIEASISYNCINQRCSIGDTAGGVLTEYFPQCVNGYIVAKSEGYEEESFMYTSVNSGEISIFLDKLYNLSLVLKVDGKKYNGEAIINFISEDTTKSLAYPLQKNIEISEGDYEVQVYVYSNSSLKLPETSIEQCVDVPRGLFGGMLGLTKKECFEVEYPSQLITSSLSAGGKQEYSIVEEYLKNSKIIELNVSRFPIPDSVQDIQNNYNLFEQKGVEINFRK